MLNEKIKEERFQERIKKELEEIERDFGYPEINEKIKEKREKMRIKNEEFRQIQDELLSLRFQERKIEDFMREWNENKWNERKWRINKRKFQLSLIKYEWRKFGINPEE